MNAKTNCRVCGSKLSAPVYESSAGKSLTSLCELRDDPTIVHFCERCGHTQTKPLGQLRDFYEHNYAILANDEEEDQLYQVRNGRNLYRTEHQLDVLFSRVPLAPNACVLDHGCAKGAVLKRLTVARPDLDLHAFDVTDRYVAWWKTFLPEGNWACHRLPVQWEGQFDLVTSFFVLEHADEPIRFLKEISDVLKPDGILHLIVPNVFANAADLVVVDHVNHFSGASLIEAICRAGLHPIHISESDHQSAWVVQAAKRPGAITAQPPSPAVPLGEQLLGMAGYWRGFADRVRKFEVTSGERKAAIYGSGFYGSLIHASMEKPEHVLYFLDKNPWRQRQTLFGKPILSPGTLPADFQSIYVGINPTHAPAAASEWRNQWPQDIILFLP